MTRALLILFAGLLAGLAGYGTLIYSGTREHRQMLADPAPELAWLKKEYQLSGAEFARIAQLHEGYMPRCTELCREIARKNSELKQLLSATNVEARLVEEKLKEAGELRVQCQQNMFNHFLEVSRQMPPEQGKRYLHWIQERALLSEHDMVQSHEAHQVMAHP